MEFRRFCLAAVLAFSGWAGSASAAFLPVTVNGVEWLQPIDFTDLGWNDISTVCEPVSGACYGTLNGFDLTGWTWGGIDAVLAMTSVFTGDSGTITGGLNTTWAPLFLQSFYATDVDPNRSMVIGLIRETAPFFDLTWYGFISITDAIRMPIVDSVSLTPTVGPLDPNPYIGAWFYRDPSNDVPVPTTLALLALSLAILAYSSSTRNRTDNPLRFIALPMTNAA